MTPIARGAPFGTRPMQYTQAQLDHFKAGSPFGVAGR